MAKHCSDHENGCQELTKGPDQRTARRIETRWSSLFPRTAMSMAAALVALGTFMSLQAD